MIVVVGRPGLAAGRSADEGPAAAGRAALLARACTRAGARVELVGTVGDDGEGDLVAIALGRAGVGHAALLRDPAARTPVIGPGGERLDPGPSPRIEAADIELGLRYLDGCRVVVLAETLSGEAVAAAGPAAAYHGATLIALLDPGEEPSSGLADAIVLVVPAADPDAEDLPEPGPQTLATAPPEDAGQAAFLGFVAALATGLDRGQEAHEAFEAAARAGGWEPSTDD